MIFFETQFIYYYLLLTKTAAPLLGCKQRQHGELHQFEAAVQHDQRGGFFGFVQRQNQNALQHKVQKRDDGVAV